MPEIAAANGQKIDPEIRRDLVEPFIAAAITTLGEMAGAELIVRGVSRQQAPGVLEDIAAVVEVTAAASGFLVVSMPRPTAAALAGRVLAESGAQADEGLIRDCVGEIANVIAGQAKALLAGGPYRFVFSVPKVTNSASNFPQGLTCLVIDFGCEQGEFALMLLLRFPASP